MNPGHPGPPKKIAPVKVLAANVEGADAKSLRDTLDQCKNKLGSAVILLLGNDLAGKTIAQIQGAGDGFGPGADERDGEHGRALSQVPAPVKPAQLPVMPVQRCIRAAPASRPM